MFSMALSSSTRSKLMNGAVASQDGSLVVAKMPPMSHSD